MADRPSSRSKAIGPESDGPDHPEPPALPHEKPRDPKSPEKSDDVHGAPATPV